MSRRFVWAGALVAALVLTVSLVADHHLAGEKKGQEGKIQLLVVMTAPAELVDQGREMFKDHAGWMEKTHHKDGDKALLRYNLSIAPELTNPMDAASEPTGRVHFILAEVYESPAGVADHFAQGQASWDKYPELMDFIGKCDSVVVTGAEIVHSLW